MVKMIVIKRRSLKPASKNFKSYSLAQVQIHNSRRSDLTKDSYDNNEDGSPDSSISKGPKFESVQKIEPVAQEVTAESPEDSEQYKMLSLPVWSPTENQVRYTR